MSETVVCKKGSSRNEEKKKVVETIALGFLGTEGEEMKEKGKKKERERNHESSERETTNGAKTRDLI